MKRVGRMERYRFNRAPGGKMHFIDLRPWSMERGIRAQKLIRIGRRAQKRCACIRWRFRRARKNGKEGTSLQSELKRLEPKLLPNDHDRTAADQ
jgi:hypothetical protein